MKPEDYKFLSALVHERSGLSLTPEKGYLLESRLAPIARREGYGSLDEMIAAMRTRRDDKFAWLVTEAMTTNETFFFRDKTPFEALTEHVLPELISARRASEPFRIWCAAASTGQEPYSIAMLIDQMRPKIGGRPVEIVATDICSKALEKAKAGLYSQFEIQRGLPVQMLVKHFEKVDDLWRVSPALKQMVSFRRFNLLDEYRALGKFDVVFCRNVLIYFDQETKRSVLERMAGQMQNDAYLLLGAAETVMGLTEAFGPVKGRRGLYQRGSSAAVRAA